MLKIGNIFGEFGTDKWFKRNQLWLLGAVNNHIPKVREYFRENIGLTELDSKIKIVKVCPNAVHYQLDKEHRQATFNSYATKSNAIRRNFDRLLSPIHKFDLRIANPFIPILNFGFDTLTAYSSTNDGWVYKGGIATWTEARDAVTGDGATTAGVSYAQAMMSRYDVGFGGYTVIRSFFYFDTSSMGAGKTISSSVFSLYGVTNNTSTVCVQQGAQAATLVAADFDSFTGNSFGISGAWSTAGYNDITLNSSGNTFVNNNANSKLCSRDYTYDYLNSAPVSTYRSGCYFANNATNNPKLVITYSQSVIQQYPAMMMALIMQSK